MTRKTKIIATIGPSCSKPQILKKMIRKGVNVCRLNFSHLTLDKAKEIISSVKTINQELSVHTAIMADLQGPKIRIKKIHNKTGELNSVVGQKIRIGNSKDCDLSVDYRGFAKDIKRGDSVLIEDGKIILKVLETDKKTHATLKSLSSGVIKERKGINLPDTNIKMSSMTKKDFSDLRFVLSENIEWIAMSFVRKKDDVISLQRRIKKSASTARVIAKIEKPEAVKNIDEIIECADGIMIARGDLGVELPAHKVPVLQKKIVNKCRFASKPCIIATQMLESMTNNFSATRAEINDVSNSVFDGADALMLSGETSIGIQPLKVIDTMRKTIKDAEKSMEDFEFKKIKGRVSTNRKVADNICKNAVKAANDLNAKAIISATYSGYSALKVSSYRPRAFIYAFTNNHSILNTMSIYWGVVGIYYDRGSTTDQLVHETIEVLQKNKIVKKGELVINTASMPAKEKGGTNTLKISRV